MSFAGYRQPRAQIYQNLGTKQLQYSPKEREKMLPYLEETSLTALPLKDVGSMGMKVHRFGTVGSALERLIELGTQGREVEMTVYLNNQNQLL